TRLEPIASQLDKERSTDTLLQLAGRGTCLHSSHAKYAEFLGKPAKSWLSSPIRGTAHTPAFLKEFGLIAYCDYLNDDQPYLIDTVHGPIVCVPYSNDINDFSMFARGGLSTRDGVDMLRLCFDQ